MNLDDGLLTQYVEAIRDYDKVGTELFNHMGQLLPESAHTAEYEHLSNRVVKARSKLNHVLDMLETKLHNTKKKRQ